LTCAGTQFTGLEAFVGGASDGKVGIAAMRYTNPGTKSLTWQKSWFFLEGDVQHVMISNVSSTSGRPVLSILDQRRRSGGVFINGAKRTDSKAFIPSAEGTTLWHGGVGYVLDSNNNATVSVQVGPKTGNWSTIGTSTQPPATVDLFAAWITHGSLASSIAYTAFPGTDLSAFLRKKDDTSIHTIQNDDKVSAIFDRSKARLMAVFWAANGGTTKIPLGIGDAAVTVSSSANAVLIFQVFSGEVTVSDPSQTLSSLSITFGFELWAPKKWSSGRSKTLTFTLPSGGQAGDSVSQNLYK